MNALTVTGAASVVIGLDASAISQRDQVVAEAQAVQAITSPLSFKFAAEALRALQGIRSEVEKSRKDVKGPVLDLGKRIDSTAAEFVGPVETEFQRLNNLSVAYQREELRKQQEAERKAAEERARIEREAAELRRKEEEARRAAEMAVTEAQHAEATKQAQEAATQAAAVEAQPVAVPVYIAPKPAGVSARTEWTFELTDVQELAKARPELVQIMPRKAEILTRIRGGERNIPGLRIFEDVAVRVRS